MQPPERLRKERRALLAAFEEGTPPVLVTSRVLDEGEPDDERSVRDRCHDWRSAIAEQVAGKVEHQHRSILAAAFGYTVAVVFYLPPQSFTNADPDNLAKPVMDTLFRAKHIQAKRPGVSGILVGVDDSAVYRLVLEKRLVESEEEAGADIKVGLHRA